MYAAAGMAAASIASSLLSGGGGTKIKVKSDTHNTVDIPIDVGVYHFYNAKINKKNTYLNPNITNTTVIKKSGGSNLIGFLPKFQSEHSFNAIWLIILSIFATWIYKNGYYKQWIKK